MRFKAGAPLFLLAAVVFYSAIGISVTLSPWFSWTGNALSDLGNMGISAVAPIFNGGLLLTGFLLIFYAFFCLMSSAPRTAYLLALSGFAMQLVGTFSEAYGSLHTYVSILLFVFLLITSIAYFFEKGERLALIVLVAFIPWALYALGMFFEGAAIPELISSLVVIPWLVASMLDKPQGG